MPELPDVTVYVEALEARVLGKRLARVKLLNPFILRTAVPPIGEAEGKRVVAVRRVGKRIVLELEGPLYLVLHLMIAGRLRWLEAKEKAPGRITLALLEFDNGTLAFTEAGTKRRASLHLLSSLEGLDPGGIEIFASDLADRDDLQAQRRGGDPAFRSDPEHARALDRAVAQGGGRRLSGEGQRVP